MVVRDGVADLAADLLAEIGLAADATQVVADHQAEIAAVVEIEAAEAVVPVVEIALAAATVETVDGVIANQ